MTQFLPPNLLALFAPRDPIPYMPPVDKLPHEKKQTHNYQGIANYVHLFEDPVDTPAPVGVETREERRERRKKEKAEQVAYKLEQEIALWDPNAIDSSMGDPFKTLFTARVNFYTSESKLRREFEQYGPVKSIKMVHNTKNGKPRGYAFIEYEHEKDMHCGGLGGTRRGGADVNVRHSGRDDTRRDRDGDRRRRSRSRSRDKRRRSRSRDRKPRRSRSRDRKRSRSRDRKRSKRSRSRSRERRREKRERREGAGAEEGFHVKEEPADSGYNDQYGSYDYQGINVKQEKVEGGDDSIAEQGEMMEPVDRNLPMAAPGEEGDYGY